MAFFYSPQNVTIRNFGISVPVGGVPVTANTTASYSVSYTSGDDFIGESIVDYCDSFAFKYKPNGQVEMYMSERCK